MRADSLLELAADPGLVALAAAHPAFLVDYAELLASGASLGLRAADVMRVLAACVD